MQRNRDLDKYYIIFFKLYFKQVFCRLYELIYFQVIAAFLARRYRNQFDPQEQAARAVFPQHNYLY